MTTAITSSARGEHIICSESLADSKAQIRYYSDVICALRRLKLSEIRLFDQQIVEANKENSIALYYWLLWEESAHQ